MTPYRETVRSLLRERLLDAAYELIAADGWAKMRMTRLAAAAGVSRQTVYTEFGTRDAIGEALVLREEERFLTGIQERLDANINDMRAAVTAGVCFLLRQAVGNPLVKAILTGTDNGNEELLALLTVRSDLLVRTAETWLGAYAADTWPAVDPLSRSLAVETTVRVTISHVLQPVASPEETAERVAEIVMRIASPSP
ncbi:TetR family transcriptional regulator [Spirillospora sp. NPDC048823]|uniref:TetR family transcriptional regulator n=1 Tax=unclassified Spirillospora TaxID=2642701 RepID=UPI003714CB99